MKIGIICPSEIAYRRFLPALKLVEGAEFVGVAVNSPEERYGNELPESKIINKMLEEEKEKAQKMVAEYGGRIFGSYDEIISSKEVDAMYLPLPPALHYEWSKKTLEYGKHVLVEKPATINLDDTKDLIDLSNRMELAFHENYMFTFHNQINYIKSVINSGEIGDIRLYRVFFGFPRRAMNDFRYNKALGGGALIDAGGYTIKLAALLLGETAHFQYSQLNYMNEFDVDIYGSGALVNNSGATAQIAFGMDNDYKCELEVWGSKGTLKTGRVLTAPPNLEPEIVISKNAKEEKVFLPMDDTFKKSIEFFTNCINDPNIRRKNKEDILKQAALLEEFVNMSEKFDSK